MFKKILIANRGEISVRVAKACRELHLTSAAIYSEADKNSLHVRAADEAYLIGPAPVNKSYLDIEKIIKLAKKIGADAIHPGYGFLSENAKFIKRVEDSGITFIGPSSDAVALMGDKTKARTLMSKSGVPIVPGTTKPVEAVEEGIKIAGEIGFPIMLKAAAGGGGKGMRKVFNAEEFEPALKRAQNEALSAFGSDEVYIEKFIENPKHIEVQILADSHGSYFHLFERECSVQRRHQKVIEESPSSFVDEETRNKITQAAIEAAKACKYVNAGTIEFLMDKNKQFYFLEMNTRLQVEHPVTELITGVDLVKEQIRIAAGQRISFVQDDLKIHGHSIEARIYAEDVENNFAPSTGKIIHHRLPSGPGVRVDRGIDLSSDVSVYYDPMLSKVCAWGKDRTEAVERLKRALGEYQIAGVITNIHALRWVLRHKLFLDGSFDIDFLEKEFLPKIPGKWKEEENPEFIEVVSILAAMLKSIESEFKPVNLECLPTNEWSKQNYE